MTQLELGFCHKLARNEDERQEAYLTVLLARRGYDDSKGTYSSYLYKSIWRRLRKYKPMIQLSPPDYYYDEHPFEVEEIHARLDDREKDFLYEPRKIVLDRYGLTRYSYAKERQCVQEKTKCLLGFGS